MEFGFYSFSEPFKPGIDFFTPDEALTLTVVIAVESNLTTTITKTAFAQSNISSDSNVSTIARRIIFASSSIVADGATLTLGTRVKLAQVAISIDSNSSTNITKIAFASVSIEASITSFVTIAQEILKAQIAIDISSNVVATMTKDSFAASIISPSSTVTTIARKIKFASSTINSNVNLTVLGKIVLLTARINQLFNNTTITVQTVKFSNTAIAYGETTTVDFSSIRSLLMLDGVPLTNQNRKLDVSAAPIFIENLNWQGDASRYYKNASANSAAKRTFNLQWTFIPNFENKTVDLRASRNFLNKKSKDGDVHILTILKQDEDGTTPYTEESVDVLIVNYSENLIRRDLVDDVYYFDCSMSLQEV